MTTVVSPNDEQTRKDVVYALAESPRSLFAARLSGLYRSQDRGQTWENVFASLATVQPVTATAVVTTEDTVFAGSNGAVLRSEDAGDTWHIAGLASPPPHVVTLTVSPSYREDGVVVAGTAEDGVFVSADRGMTWVPWNFGLVDPNVYALVISPEFHKDRIIFAGTESGLFRSHNGGRSWREVVFPMDAAPIISLGISPAFATDGLVYAGTEQHGLFISDDSGIHWRQIKHDLISAAINAIQIGPPPVYEVRLLLVDKLVHSTDRGRSWTHHPCQIPSGKMAMTMLSLRGSAETVLVGFAEGDILPLR